MSITESSSKTTISQEVENPISFNFSIPPPEESPSTPVCDVGEMDESISPAADILVCYVLHSGNKLVCSPTLVLSSDKSPNLEAQFVSKPNEGLPTEKIDIGSMAGKENYDDEENLEKLTYLNLVIKETLRLHTPIPLLPPREWTEQTDIDGCTIPLKTRILVNAWALARDPESWHDPESFIPERFENSSIDFMGNRFEFLPFGAGRRICPGILFGLFNVKLPLAQLLYHLEWELPYGMNPKDLDMTETHGLSGAKQNDLYLVARS
uniref:Cytochrome P450 71D7 n=1 Tax=Solanum tuberosum TaxID=4113 RepID=M1D8C0_SOLTU